MYLFSIFLFPQTSKGESKDSGCQTISDATVDTQQDTPDPVMVIYRKILHR